MKWDIKLVAYSLLIYFTFGLINLISLGDFVVPLPLSYIFCTIISLIYFFTSKISIHSLLFICIPLIVLKDLIIHYNLTYGKILIISSIISWGVFGILLLIKFRNQILSNLLGIALIFLPIILLNHSYISIPYLLLVLFLNFKVIQKQLFSVSQIFERINLLIALIIGLFLLNELSIYLVNQ